MPNAMGRRPILWSLIISLWSPQEVVKFDSSPFYREGGITPSGSLRPVWVAFTGAVPVHEYMQRSAQQVIEARIAGPDSKRFRKHSQLTSDGRAAAPLIIS